MLSRHWRKPIGEILVNKELLTKEQLEYALDQQKQKPGEKIGQILIKLGYVTKKDVLKAYAEQLGSIYDSGTDTD